MDAEDVVPGGEDIEDTLSGWVRMKESMVTLFWSMALVLVTVIVYTSIGSSLLLPKRVVRA